MPSDVDREHLAACQQRPTDDQASLQFAIYQRKRWSSSEIEIVDFSLHAIAPPITLFDVPLESQVFLAEEGGPWERVLLRKERGNG